MLDTKRPVTDTETVAKPVEGKQRGLGRAIVIGMIGVLGTAVVVTQAEMVLSSVRIGYLQMPPVALGLLLLLAMLGNLGRRISKRLMLSKTELLVVYIMMLVSAMVSSHGIAQKLVPLLVIPNYFADSSNGWQSMFGAHTPQGLVPYSPGGGASQPVAAYFYDKLPRGVDLPWHAWVTPLINWGVLVCLVVFSFLCLASLLRRAWIEGEKLSFPLAQVPIIIADDGVDSPLRARSLRFGLLIPVCIYAINGLHQAAPSIPAIPLTFLVNDFLQTPPWNALYYTPVLISFAAIGFFFLLPLDILLSIWAFFLLSRLMQVGSLAYNIDGIALASSLKCQTIGAYVTIVGMLFWASRAHWASVWRSATGRDQGADSGEMLPYPVAFWGLIVSMLLSVCWLSVMGMSIWLAAFELVVCLFLIGPIMARSTAEAGLLMTETTFRPIDIFAFFAPVHSLGAVNITMVSFFDSMFLRDQRGLLLTGFLDSLRIVDATTMPRRKLFPILAGAVALALVAAVAMNIVLPYHIGALNMDHWMEQGSSRWVFNDDAEFIKGGVHAQPFWAAGGSAVAGAVVAGLLYVLRVTCYWWPFHPLGYALMGTWSTTEFWFSCLLAWLFKSLALRYGGTRMVTQATPFFLGLVIGEFGMAVLYVLLNLAFHIQPPPFPWG